MRISQSVIDSRDSMHTREGTCMCGVEFVVLVILVLAMAILAKVLLIINKKKGKERKKRGQKRRKGMKEG